MDRLPLSVALITYNEEENIGPTLRAVQDIAAEIIIVDSHSTDNTRQIAQSLGAQVYEEDWKGYRDQKNSALSKCTQPWILSLDADEVLTDRLKKEITQAILHPRADGYFINRRTVFLGKDLKHALYPDRQLRLVRRSANPRWTGGSVHELLKVDGTTARLKGFLLHYSYRDLNDFLVRLDKYARLWAQDAANKNKKIGLRRLLLSPVMAFVKNYLLKLGLLDGMRGFIVSCAMCYYSLLKAFYLWEKKHGRKR